MNNTEKKYTIKNKNNNLKKYVIGGCIVSSLFVATISMTSKGKNTSEGNIEQNTYSVSSNDESYDTSTSGFNYYSSQYIKALKNQEKDQFDEKFIDIYDNCKFIMNNEKYDNSEIYIVKMLDGSSHIFQADNNKIDLITGTEISGKKIHISNFRDSTAFLDMYNAGVINDKNINLNDSFIKYINNWDGLKHENTPSLKADKEAQEAYARRFKK